MTPTCISDQLRHSGPDNGRRVPAQSSHANKGPGDCGDQQSPPSPPSVRWSIPLFSGELASFLPVGLNSLDWSSRGRSLSVHLVESSASGIAIHLQVSLSDEEGEMLLGALGEDRMEDPVVEVEGDVEVVCVEFKCRK